MMSCILERNMYRGLRPQIISPLSGFVSICYHCLSLLPTQFCIILPLFICISFHLWFRFLLSLVSIPLGRSRERKKRNYTLSIVKNSSRPRHFFGRLNWLRKSVWAGMSFSRLKACKTHPGPDTFSAG